MRTLEWDDAGRRLKMIDQRALPSQLTYLYMETFQSVIEAIKNMAVRGAPAIGVAAAFGVVLAAQQSEGKSREAFLSEIEDAVLQLAAARPTAVNLTWALKRMGAVLETGFETIDQASAALLATARKMADEDVETNISISKFGAELIEDGDTIIHHCNTGALATVDWGTALGVIRMAHEQGIKLHVLVDETRPRLQGARLTAWELSQYGIPYDIINDNAAGFFLQRGQVQKVIFGADRVARNGDVANKIGSYMLALAAHANQVPVYSVFPTSTVDPETETGGQIVIEERDPAEVLGIQFQHEMVAPPGATARNPAFDVTPNKLITAWVTEIGVIHSPFAENIEKKGAE